MTASALHPPSKATMQETLLAALIFIGSVFAIWWLSETMVDRDRAAGLSDNEFYIRMAQGDYSVPKPFNTRIVAPWLAGHLSTAAGLSIANAFLILEVCAFTILHFFALLSIRRLFPVGLISSVTATSFCFIAPGFAWLVGALYYPDLLFLAWTAVCIWAWLTKRWWLVTLSLFLALITRDSSALPLGAVIMLSSLIERRKGGIIAVIAAVILQKLFFKLVYAPGIGNVHGLTELPYLLLKLVSNSSRAYLGLTLWTNTLYENEITRASNPIPPTVFELPAFLHMGGIHQVGIYPWSLKTILVTFLQMAVIFGLPLLVALALCRRLVRKASRLEMTRQLGLPAVMVLIYGVLMLFLGPATGTDLPRLIMAAWPAVVLVGAGWLLSSGLDSRVAVILISLSTLFSWISYLVWRMAAGILMVDPSATTALISLIIFGVAAAITFRFEAKRRRNIHDA